MTVFQTVIVFDDLKGFEEHWSDVLWGAPLGEFGVFFMIRREFLVLGGNIQR